MSEPPEHGYQIPPLTPVPPGTPFPAPSDPLVSPDYAGWWRRNLALLKAYWKPLAVLQLIGAVVALMLRIPADLIQAIQSRDLQTGAPTDTAAAMRQLGKALPVVGIGLAGSLLAELAMLLVLLAGLWFIVGAVTGGRPSIGDALRGALRRAFPLIGWGTLAGLIILAGLCACILPGLYFAAVFAVLPAVVLFERGGVIARCFKLFHADLAVSVSRVATVVGLGIAASLVTAVIAGILAAVTRAAVGGTAGLVTATLITTVVSVAVTTALGVLLAPLILTTYADERARTEPFHTGVLAHELATT